MKYKSNIHSIYTFDFPISVEISFKSIQNKKNIILRFILDKRDCKILLSNNWRLLSRLFRCDQIVDKQVNE